MLLWIAWWLVAVPSFWYCAAVVSRALRSEAARRELVRYHPMLDEHRSTGN